MKVIRNNIQLILLTLFVLSASILPYSYLSVRDALFLSLDQQLTYSSQAFSSNSKSFISAKKVTTEFAFSAHYFNNSITYIECPSVAKTSEFRTKLLEELYTISPGDDTIFNVTVEGRTFRICLRTYTKNGTTHLYGAGVNLYNATASLRQHLYILSTFALITLLTFILFYLRIKEIIFHPLDFVTSSISRLEFGKTIDNHTPMSLGEFQPLVEAINNQSATIGNIIRELRHRVRVVHSNEKSALKEQIKWKTAFNSLRDIMIIFDHNFIVQDINKAGAELLGTDKEKLIGRHCHCGIFNKKICDMCWHDNGISLNERSGRLVEFSERTYLLLSSEALDENGNVLQIIDILRDITELKEAENALIHANRTVKSHDKLKSEFLNNISHELRTPLNGVIGASEALQDTHLEEEQKELISLAYNSGLTLQEMIDRIIGFTRLMDNQMVISQQLMTNHLSSHIKHHADNAHEKGLFFSVCITPDIPECFTLAGETLKLIFDELIDNAVKFTQEGYVLVRLQTADKTGSANELFPDIDTGRPAFIAQIEDTGQGIQTTDRDIFASFVQADGSLTRSHPGLGIGLTIVKEGLRQIGGQIALTDNPQGGTVVSILIPYEEVQTMAKDALIPEIV